MATSARSEGPGLVLPTANDSLLHGGGPEFYQYVVREYQGTTTYPWQGGQYGFVRNPQETPAGRVYTRFHEGIDIRPLSRDKNGEPVDEVRAVDSGKVVYAYAGQSGGYGKYIVVEHIWQGCPYYSLFAHLARIDVATGQQVSRGETLGLMGYSGSGLDRERAHLHFEINVFLSNDFEAWHSRGFKEPNHHGVYNGLNLAGIDVARFLIADAQRPGLPISEFIRAEEPFYTVRFTLPRRGIPELGKRYPWMLDGPIGESKLPASTWEMSLTASGLPLRLKRASGPPVSPSPSVIWVKPTRIASILQTRGHVSGAGDAARLTERGLQYMELILR